MTDDAAPVPSASRTDRPGTNPFVAGNVSVGSLEVVVAALKSHARA